MFLKSGVEINCAAPHQSGDYGHPRNGLVLRRLTAAGDIVSN
jgi:hypothetical protein